MSDPTHDMNFAEAAEYLGIREATLRRHNSAGTGPKRRQDGRTYFFRAVDLDAWKETLYNAPSAPKKTKVNGKKVGIKDVIA